MTSTRQRILFGALAVFAVAGIIAATMLSNRITKLEARNADFQQQLQASLRQIEAAKVELAKQTADSEQKQSAEVKELKASFDAMGKAPAPEDIAKVILSNGGDKLVGDIAIALVRNPNTVSALRGRDADSVEVAKNIAKSDSYPALVDRVAKHIWETRRRDLLSDPALIATVAAKVHEKYGSELLNTADVDKQALIIAHELAKEPGFAALVAAAKAQ